MYLGGQAEWSGSHIWSLHGGGVIIVREGAVVTRVKEDPVTCFTLRPDTGHTCLVTAHKSGLVKISDWERDNSDKKAPEIVRTFRSIHTVVIGLMSLPRVGRGRGAGHGWQ